MHATQVNKQVFNLMYYLIIDDDEEDRDTKYSSFCVLACLAASKACETSDGNNEFSKHRTINLRVFN